MKVQHDIWKGLGDGSTGGGNGSAGCAASVERHADFRPQSFLCAAQASLESLEAAAALLDENGTVLIANAAWKGGAPRGDDAALRVGGNYAQFEWELALQGDADGIRLFDGLLEIVAGIGARFESIVTGWGVQADRRFRAEFSRLEDADSCFVKVVFHDVDLRQAGGSHGQGGRTGGEIRFLTEALEILATDFGERTGVEIHTMLDDVAALPLAAEALLYNFVQEALSHLHRNVGATRATLALTETEGFVHLILFDGGSAFCGDEAVMDDAMASSSLVRIDEQLQEHGGRLTLHRVQHCTVLAASLPLAPASLS